MRMDEPGPPPRDGAVEDTPELPDEAGGGPRPEEPVRRQGNIDPALLDPQALTVVRRLSQFGHEAYLVGGCVRDLLAGLEPKDFDVVTDALPNRIKRLFRNARIIGRRFRLAHIRFGPDHVIETSTFRADPGAPNGNGKGDEGERAPGGYVADDRPNHGGTSENIFGTAPEDARRRDFTINALFYDPIQDEILDWVGGLRDIEDGVVRSIGDPKRRIVEDPVRMIRAVHFAERMGFRLEEELEEAIRAGASELEHASPARLYIELLKILNRGRARRTLERLHEMGVLVYWLPELACELDARDPADAGEARHPAYPDEPNDKPTGEATWSLLSAADRWGMAAHQVDDALALAPLLAPWILERWRREGSRRGYAAFADCCDATVRPMALRMSMPRRTMGRLRELLWVWMELRRPPHPRRAQHTAGRPAFPHSLDFLRLDLEARGASRDVLHAWEELQPSWNRHEARREQRSRDKRERPDDRERAPRHGVGRERGRDRGSRERRGRRGRRGRRERERERPETEDSRPGLEPEAEAWTPAPPPAAPPSATPTSPTPKSVPPAVRDREAPPRDTPPVTPPKAPFPKKAPPAEKARAEPERPDPGDTFAEGLE